jgi:hypothetical protein
MGEILYIGVHCQVTWWPSLLPYWFIAWTINSYWSIIQASLKGCLTLKKLFRVLQRSVNILESPSNMFCVLTEIYWSLEQVILEQYFSNMYVFTLTDGKMATPRAHQRNILEIKKPVEVLSWTYRTTHFCHKIWILSRDTVL